MYSNIHEYIIILKADCTGVLWFKVIFLLILFFISHKLHWTWVIKPVLKIGTI